MKDNDKTNAKNGGGMRRLRMGGYSIVLVVIAIAAAVIVNMIVAALPPKYTQFELTGFGLLDVSETSQEMLKNLKYDVTISRVTSVSGEDPQITAFLDRYLDYTDKVTVVDVDPNTNPEFVNTYGVESVNSLVIQSWKKNPETGENELLRSKTIDYYEIYGFSDEVMNSYYNNPSNWQYSIDDIYQRDMFNAENKITSAIDYVTTDDLPVAYTLSGHGEIALSSVFTNFIDYNNILMDELTLAQGSVPEDAGILIINNPSQDLSEGELSVLKSYIDGGGKVLLVTDITSYSTEKMPNLTAFVNYCGLDAVDGLLLEADGSNRYVQNRYNVIATLESVDITTALYTNPTSAFIYMPSSHAIIEKEDYDGKMTVSAIAKTTENAYIVDANDGDRDRKDDDVTGEFYVGAMSRDAETGSALVWYSSEFINDEQSYQVTQSNLNVFASSISTICDKPVTVSVDGIATNANARLILKNSTATALTVSILFVIPGAILIAGFVVWLVRRLR